MYNARKYQRKIRKRMLKRKKYLIRDNDMYDRNNKSASNNRRQVIMNMRMHENDPYYAV